MGRPKAMLPFGDEVMLVRVVRLLREVVDPIVVVAAPDQQLPALPDAVRVVRDRTAGRGPLEGLYCGLDVLRQDVEAAYVTACDVPLLRAEFVRALIARLGQNDVAVPVEGKYFQPLSAIYRTRLVTAISQRLARDELRMISFYESVATHRVDIEQLRDADPDLHSLMNLNTPDDYSAALRLAGLG